MKTPVINMPKTKSIEDLPIVRNFRKVIEERDIKVMNKELYQFFILYCGFIAHYDINGFKATYGRPFDFANVFIGHFDSEHRYFNKIYPCDDAPYKEPGYTKADIKREFFRTVDVHKQAIEAWALEFQRKERYSAYLKLKAEFDPEKDSLPISCDVCGNSYWIMVTIDNRSYQDFHIICCVFCGQQIKLYKGGDTNVECAEQRKAG